MSAVVQPNYFIALTCISIDEIVEEKFEEDELDQELKSQFHYLNRPLEVLEQSLPPNVLPGNTPNIYEGATKKFLENPEYRRWVAQPRASLYCKGRPGSGLTTTTSVVLEDLKTLCAGNKNFAVVCYYCDPVVLRKRTRASFLAGLLGRFLDQLETFPTALKTYFKVLVSNDTHMSWRELYEGLKIVTSVFKRAFILIDGVDVLKSCKSDWKILIADILNLQSASGTNIFATSRLDLIVDLQFAWAPEIILITEENDIQEILKLEMRCYPNLCSQDPGLQAEVIAKISRSAEGK